MPSCQQTFYATGLHGFYGYVFADLISHDFVIPREKSNGPTQQQETITRSVVSVTTKKESEKGEEGNQGKLHMQYSRHFRAIGDVAYV